MASRVRQISIKECYEILGLQKGADLQAVKTAYRRKAFELHPDLNPGDANAGRQFQRLNEAYVALSGILKSAEEKKRKTESKESAQESGKEQRQSSGESSTDKEFSRAQAAYEKQDVLRDLLNDPFARRVFEDIYSEVSRKQEKSKGQEEQPSRPKAEPKPEAKPRTESKDRPKVAPFNVRPPEKGVKGAVKNWLIRQLDEEQTLTMPAAGLLPGRRIRLQIRPRPNDEVNSIEITLPRDFVVGKPMRLRGLGKRVGPWQGDLYLTIYPQ